MDESFWRRLWERNEIAFHERVPNPLLVTHLGDLAPPEGGRVFLPLCGKTLDIHWLLSRGYRVAGAELSELAVGQLFSELGVEPEITPMGQVSRYRADHLDVFLGDIFGLSREALGPVDAVYDRAALVALPPPIRDRYTAHLTKITDRAPQLLIAFVYDQSLMEGPPFSIGHEEVVRQYGESHDPTPLASVEVKGGLKGKCPAAEHVWLLKKR